MGSHVVGISRKKKEKCTLVKNQPVGANWRRDISIIVLQ